MFNLYEGTAEGIKINWKNLSILIVIVAAIALAIYFGAFFGKTSVPTIPSAPNVAPNQPTPPPQPTVPPAITKSPTPSPNPTTTPTPAPTPKPTATPSPTISPQQTEMAAGELLKLVTDKSPTVESLIGKYLIVKGVVDKKNVNCTDWNADYRAGVYLEPEGIAPHPGFLAKSGYVYAGVYGNKAIAKQAEQLKERDKVVVEGIFIGSYPYYDTTLERLGIKNFLQIEPGSPQDLVGGCGMLLIKITKIQ